MNLVGKKYKNNLINLITQNQNSLSKNNNLIKNIDDKIKLHNSDLINLIKDFESKMSGTESIYDKFKLIEDESNTKSFLPKNKINF